MRFRATYKAFALVVVFPTMVAGCGARNARDYGPGSRFGVNVHNELQPKVYQSVADAGIGWVRVDFNWITFEPKQDKFDFSHWDGLVKNATARGLRVFGTIAYTPAWATRGKPHTGVPNDPADWYDAVYRTVSRYKDTVHHWGMWNEPNLPNFWSGTREQYIKDILKNGANAVHAADPNAKVCGPGLAHLKHEQRDWYLWLKECIEQAGDKIDVVTHNVYDKRGSSHVTAKLNASHPLEGAAAGGGRTLADNAEIWSDDRTPSIKEVLQCTGWLGKPFWITETGWKFDYGEALVASYYTDLLETWFTGRGDHDWVDKIFFYSFRQDSNSIQLWGMVEPNLKPRGHYWAYKYFIHYNARR